MIDLPATGIQNGTAKYDFKKKADRCPFCNEGIDPKVLNVYVDSRIINVPNHTSAWIIFRCPKNDCRQIFVGVYRYLKSPSTGSYFEGPWPVYPVFRKEHKFSETINEISSDFVKIFNQAFFAEQNDLNLIVGPGYRKALEFLIKDYAKKISDPEDKENIKNIKLGQVIENYVQDERIKKVAKRAAWLGNDETHYIRKWENEDIDTLKLLIKLTTRWIEMVELTNEYEKRMPD